MATAHSVTHPILSYHSMWLTYMSCVCLFNIFIISATTVLKWPFMNKTSDSYCSKTIDKCLIFSTAVHLYDLIYVHPTLNMWLDPVWPSFGRQVCKSCSLQKGTFNFALVTLQYDLVCWYCTYLYIQAICLASWYQKTDVSFLWMVAIFVQSLWFHLLHDHYVT